MKRIISKLFKNKRHGFLLDFLPSLFLMLAAAILVYAFLGCFELLVVNEEVKQVVRGNMLLLESKGYLSASDIAQMESDIQDHTGTMATVYVSLQTVPYSGTLPLSTDNVELCDGDHSADYGDCMYLTVTAVIPGTELNNAANDIIKMIFQDKDYTATVTRMTTAKY